MRRGGRRSRVRIVEGKMKGAAPGAVQAIVCTSFFMAPSRAGWRHVGAKPLRGRDLHSAGLPNVIPGP
jgi:hypothetical protein